MKHLITSKEFLSSNGDATETFRCRLTRDNISVREFVNAIGNSVDGKGAVFRESWAVISMSIEGRPVFPAVAYYIIYGNLPKHKFRDIELEGQPSTLEDILDKYGNYIVSTCKWNGGWGMGGYYLQIREPRG